MVTIEEWTTIPVTKKMAERLRQLGRKGEKYEDILNKLLSGVDWNEVGKH